MTNTYNTLNPLGSTSAKDLSDNASNFDEGMNSLSPGFYDRFKRRRETWAGMQKLVTDFLEAMGFEATHLVYVDGTPLTVLRPTQLIDRAGSVYKVKQPATFPVNLTGNWATDQLLLVDAGDEALRAALADPSSPLNGAAMVARSTQVVDSVAALRNLSNSSASKFAETKGHTASRPGLGAGWFYYDSADVTTPDDNGYVIVAADGGRWKRPWTGTVSPFDYGAAGGGSVDDRLAVRGAIAIIRAKGNGTLDTSGGNFQISGPEKAYQRMHIGGTGTISAHSTFTADVSFPTYITNVPQVYNCLLYVNEGTHADDPFNFGWLGFTVATGVKFYGGFLVENGLIMEGITKYSVDGDWSGFNSFGVWAKYYCWGGRIPAYIHDCATGLLKLGEAANGVSLEGAQLFGGSQTPTYGVQIVGDNNGVNLSGAFVEKCVNNVYVTGFNGPINISGVDFEDSTAYCVTVDGTGIPGGRAAGPVTISGCFLEAPQSCVLAINAIVHVTGCRLRDSAVAFTATGASSVIYDSGNTIESTIVARSSGNVVSDYFSLSSRRQVNHIPNGSGSYVDSYAIQNNSYFYDETLQTSGLVWRSATVDAPTQRMLSSSAWTTSEMRAGALYASTGVILDMTAGAKNFGPIENGTHYCGYVGASWAGGSTVVAFTVTSDLRKKQQIRDISAAEKAVAKRIKPLLRAFKLNSQVESRGDKADIHIGVIAQDVIAAFRAEGLNGLDYAIVNYEEWEASDTVEAGSLFSVNYEQLLAFILSAVDV